MKKTLITSFLFAATAATMGLDAWAHTTIEGNPACSPHAASSSKGGTTFSNCSTQTYWDKYGEPSGFKYSRTIFCALGTTCSNVLCGTGKYVAYGKSGQSVTLGQASGDDPGYKHGVPAVTSLICY